MVASPDAPHAHPTRPRNRLLATLKKDDLARLVPDLEPVTCAAGHPLIARGAVITHVLFVERGLVSLVACADAGRYEVGMVGPEGLVGLPVLLGVTRSPDLAIVRGAGEALRVPAAALRAAMEESPALRGLLLRYVHAFLVQQASTARAYAADGVEKRLARWLLMMRDRLGRDDVALTHDLLAAMVGGRRPRMTLAVHALERAGLVRAARGLIVVRDRAGLEGLAGESYGRAEAEYDAVMRAVAIEGAGSAREGA